MRVLVHDYSGHPGQLSLSRELARRGHQVLHQWCPSYTTGRGDTSLRPDDPAGLAFEPLPLHREFARYSPLVRVVQELHYGVLAARRARAARPDVVLLSNVPLLALGVLTASLRLRRVPYVFWQQDVYSVAIAAVARARLGRAGVLVGVLAGALEGAVARGAAVVVPISEAFLPRLLAWRVLPERLHVVPNWAAIQELPERARDNAWAREHGLASVPVVLYAGTLGLKHDPGLLLALARQLPAPARLVVVSEGIGRAELERARARYGLDRLDLLDFQPYAQLPDVLASADVLLVVLEPEASRYSVPSKVLTYLCAGRPVVAVLPSGNAASLVLRDAGAGAPVEPGDREGAARAVLALLADPGARAEQGRAGRAYAESTFDVCGIGRRFEDLLRLADSCVSLCERRDPV